MLWLHPIQEYGFSSRVLYQDKRVAFVPCSSCLHFQPLLNHSYKAIMIVWLIKLGTNMSIHHAFCLTIWIGKNILQFLGPLDIIMDIERHSTLRHMTHCLFMNIFVWPTKQGYKESQKLCIPGASNFSSFCLIMSANWHFSNTCIEVTLTTSYERKHGALEDLHSWNHAYVVSSIRKISRTQLFHLRIPSN